MRQHLLKNLCPVATIFLIMSCTDDIANSIFGGGDTINLSGNINQEYVTRANDDGFADGDRMGIFIVDYDGSQPGTLSESGNRANNALFQYDYSSGKWSSGTQFYWKDKETAIDVYGYYPYASSITDIDGYSIEVEYDQSVAGSEGTMGNYEKSDFLWAKSTGVSPTSETIKLNYSHRMAGVKVTLTRGDGITETEWSKVSKLVTVDNTIRTATIDLSTGVATPNGSIDKNIVMAAQGDDTWRAVVVPQTIANGTRFIGITIDGTSYNYVRTEDLTLKQGKLHKFTIQIDKKDGGDYTFALVDEEIGEWENDNSSHEFSSAEYTIVNTVKPGTLKATIDSMGKDYTTIKNLKIIGPLTTSDFEFMKNDMTDLAMLNMKEVTCKNCTVGYWEEEETIDNAIPNCAFLQKSSLRRLVLPDNLQRVGPEAFSHIGLDANSTLILPKGLKRIDGIAFGYMTNCGELILNDSLEYIGAYGLASNFTCDLNLPNTLKYIGSSAFNGMTANGHFYLPNGMETIESGAFAGVTYDEVGEVIVPQNMAHIYRDMFPSFTKGTILTLHDGVKEIEGAAFTTSRFINHIDLPEGLTSIGEQAFSYAQFSAGITLPSTLRKFGTRAFMGASGLGKVELPEGISEIASGCFYNSDIEAIELPSTVEAISSEAFAGSQLKSIKIGKYCDYIGKRAFHGAEQLQSIICLNPEPPALDGLVSDPDYNHPFGDCSYDHLILQVPEQSVELYRNTEGWNKIRFITAYHELAIDKSEIDCLDGGMTYETLVRAEGEWEVTECPSWCSVSPTSSSDRRTEVTIKVDATTQGTERSGQIVFKLKDSDYTTYTTVNQKAYDYAQDNEIVFHEASAGGKEIPVFFVGDGFDANDITDGTYMTAMNAAYENFFSIEPYKTYKDYFTASTAVAVSPDQGLEKGTETVKTNFNIRMDDYGFHIDYPLVKKYAKNVSSHISDANVGNALIVIVPNYQAFMGDKQIDDDGTTMAVCGYSQDTYPYDFRGTVQFYAGGLAFGRLAPEYVSHRDFIKACTCGNCNGIEEYNRGKQKGWYGNVSLSSSMNSLAWKDLIFDSRYSDIVDVYEGGYRHARGVFRSESQSCMSTYVHYYNTISRMLIVKRIMQLAGKTFSFEDFVSNDSRDGIPE